MAERSKKDDDRRRSPRFSCAGHAKISCLPSDGVFLPGQIRDLSLGGCWVDTTLPIDHGVRTEMIVRVNAASFRAVGEVRAIRAGPGASVEFVHLSAGGKDILADLVRELARLQAIIKKLRSERRDEDTELFRRQIEHGKLQAAMLSGRYLLVGTTTLGVERPGESSGSEQAASPGKDSIAKAQALVIPVDVFG